MTKGPKASGVDLSFPSPIIRHDAEELIFIFSNKHLSFLLNTSFNASE